MQDTDAQPVFVTSYHLGCAVSPHSTPSSALAWPQSGPLADDQALGTRILRRTTNLMDGLDRITMTVGSATRLYAYTDWR
jgi:hypothetical protein